MQCQVEIMESIYQLIFKLIEMKKLNRMMFLAFVAIVGFTACENSEQPKGAYQAGVIVINEGNFTDADGSLSYFNTTTKEVETNIFSKVNNEAILGDVVQSVTVHGDIAYVIVNNSNKVEVVNAHTMESITSFESMMPRYMAIANGKGYLTEWDADFVNFTNDSKVLIVDLNTHTVTGSIKTGSGAEQIVFANGNLYVSDSWDNTITVINPVTDMVVTTITTDFYGISGLAVDDSQNIWGIYSGSYDWTTYEPNNDGAIVNINTTDNSIASVTSVGRNISSKIAMNSTKDELLYIAGTRVYSFNTTSLVSSELLNEAAAISFYGIGVDATSNTIYVGDSKGFQGNGTIFRYNVDGTSIDSFEVGRGPNGFIFK